MLTSRRVSLNLPPYLSSAGQFSSKEVKETKTIAKLRIHVEMAIRRIKKYHIYDTPIPLSLLGTINQLWTVTCLLVNFQGPLILKRNSSKFGREFSTFMGHKLQQKVTLPLSWLGHLAEKLFIS